MPELTETQKDIEYVKSVTTWTLKDVRVFNNHTREWAAIATTTRLTKTQVPERSFLILCVGTSYTMFQLSSIPYLMRYLVMLDKW